MANPADEWTDTELCATVDDYLAMLTDETAGRPYSKTDHRTLPVKLGTGRIEGAISEPSVSCTHTDPPSIDHYTDRTDLCTSFGADPVPVARTERRLGERSPRPPPLLGVILLTELARGRLRHLQYERSAGGLRRPRFPSI